MRFTHIDINFDVKYEGHQNCSKTLSMHILRVFGHHHMWRQNWYQYVWTSLCQFIFFVNLLHSPCVWLFDIWHLFDNLTSFWQLDIFLTTWHIFWNVGNGTHGQMGIMVNTEDRDGALRGWGTWVMGHMDNRTHGQWVMGNRVSWLILKVEMGHLGGWGTLGDGAHGQWGTWAIGHMIITSLILHGSLQKFYCT